MAVDSPSFVRSQTIEDGGVRAGGRGLHSPWVETDTRATGVDAARSAGVMFDPRVAGEHHDDLQRQVLAARLTLCLVAGAGAGFLPPSVPDHRALLAWLVPTVFVPFDGMLFIIARRGALRLATFIGVAGELFLVFVCAVLVPPVVAAVMLGYVFLVSLYTYLCGRRLGLCAACGAIALLVLARWMSGPMAGLTGESFAVFSVIALASAVLVDRATQVQRRAADELDRLRNKGEAILARVADGVVVTDPRGRIDQLNDAASRLFSCERSTALRRRCEDVLGLHLDNRMLDCSNGCALLAEEVPGDAHLGIEVWRPTADGGRQPLLANVSAITGPDGRPVEIVHSLRDVTRLKQAEEAKTLFLATASHELKTPLTVIQGFAQTLQRNPVLSDDDRARALGAIERRALELARIVDRLLLSSRIEAGRLLLSTRPVDAAPLLVQRAQDLAAATGRPVEIEVPDMLPPVKADVDALVTVVDHLLDNAMKYSPNAKPVSVSAVAVGDRVAITICDRGIGMDAEQAARCFDKFWQADSTNSRRFGGTGIGLYIVRSLVEAMGGSVTATSRRGEGTSFVVSLLAAGDDRQPAPNDGPDVIREVIRQAGVAIGSAR